MSKIFDYMDAHLFLKDFYNQQKKYVKGFSYTSWSVDLGFKNKTILRMMLQKKRTISPKSLFAFQTYFKFNDIECRYFENLVYYSQFKNMAQKQAYGLILIKIQRENFNPKILDVDSAVLFDVYSPIVFTIVNSADSPLNTAQIKLHCGIDEKQIDIILNQLANAGLVLKNDDLYSARHSTFKITDQPAHTNLQNYYKFWLEKSSKAIALPFEMRRFRSLQIALSKSEFDEIVHQTNEFANLLLSMVQTNSIEDRKLYLLNTALFPVKEVSL